MDVRFSRICAAMIMFVLWGAAWPVGSRAQDSETPATPPADHADQADSTPVLREIYVPFNDLTEAFQQPGSRIVLPYDQYRKLLDAFRKSERPLAAPESIITQADYTVTVEEDLARIHAKLTIRVLKQGWAELALNFQGATIGRMTSADQVLLRGGVSGQNQLLFPHAGEYVVELELASAVHQSPEARELSFQCPPVAQTTIDVTVPGESQQLTFQPPGVPFEGPAPQDQPPQQTTRQRTSLGATEKIVVRWRPAASQMPAMDLLASVNNRTLITIADGLVHTEAWLDYTVLRGQLQEARVAIPKTARLLDVIADQEVSTWTTAEEAGSQIVTIKLAQPVKQQLQLTIRTESKLTETEITVAGMTAEKVSSGIHVLDAVRESGQLAVRHAPDLNVNVIQQQGLIRIENSEADPQLSGTNALLFKFYSPQILLQLSVRAVQPRISVVHQADLRFGNDDLQLSDQFEYQIELAGVFELQFQLPAEVVVDQVDCPAMKEYSVDKATRILTISLRERTLGRQILVHLQAHRPLAQDLTADLQLPLIEPLHVGREEGTIRVFARDALEVQALPEGLQGVEPMSLAERTQSGDMTLTAAWMFHRRPVVISVRIVRKPARLTAQLGTTITLQPELAQVSAQLRYQIEYASLDEFRLQVPEAVSPRLQIEVDPASNTSAPIKQKAAAPAENGWVTWTIQTQRKVLGTQVFLIKYDVAPPTAANPDKPAREQSYHFPLIRPLGLVNAQGEATTPLVELRGEVLLTKDRTLALNATTTGEGIEQVDVRELRLLPQQGTLAFRYFRNDAEHPVSLNITASRFDIQDVVSTVISRGLVEIVSSEEQASTYRCRYLMKSSERQRLLIGLPKDLEVLGAFLNDREIQLEKADTAFPGKPSDDLAPFWLNVARPESSEVPFLLTFQFLWTLPSKVTERLQEAGELQLPLPVIGGGNQTVVQELKVVMWVPEQSVLVGDPDPFVLQKQRAFLPILFGSPADHSVDGLQNWISAGGRSPSAFADLPTRGRHPYQFTTLGSASEITVRVWSRLWMTTLISITLVVIGWILLGTSWENKLGILLLMSFAAVLYGLFDNHGLREGLLAARIGLLVMLAMWVLHSCARALKPKPDPKSTYHPDGPVNYAVIPPPGIFEKLHPDSSGSTS